MNKNTRELVQTAIFVALILLLGLTPIGMIPLGFINLSLLGIPVVIGTLLLGLRRGLLLGLCFGAVSAMKAFGLFGAPSTLVATLMAQSPVLAMIMTFLPRLLVRGHDAALLSRGVRAHEAQARGGHCGGSRFVDQYGFLSWPYAAVLLHHGHRFGKGTRAHRRHGPDRRQRRGRRQRAHFRAGAGRAVEDRFPQIIRRGIFAA